MQARETQLKLLKERNAYREALGLFLSNPLLFDFKCGTEDCVIHCLSCGRFSSDPNPLTIMHKSSYPCGKAQAALEKYSHTWLYNKFKLWQGE